MQLKSLSEVNASPHGQLHKAAQGSNKKSLHQPFQDVNQIFNQPVADHGHTTYCTPNCNASHADDESSPLEYPESSTSPPHHCSSWRLSMHHFPPAWHQKLLPPSSSPSPTGNLDAQKHTHSHSLSNVPPWKHAKDHSDSGQCTSNHEHHSNDATSTTTKQDNACSDTNAQQQVTATQPTTLKPLQWLNDQVLTGCPKAHDYDHDICCIIIKSHNEFSATVCTQNALPT